jgi:hypothetical protein
MCGAMCCRCTSRFTLMHDGWLFASRLADALAATWPPTTRACAAWGYGSAKCEVLCRCRCLELRSTLPASARNNRGPVLRQARASAGSRAFAHFHSGAMEGVIGRGNNAPTRALRWASCERTVDGRHSPGGGRPLLSRRGCGALHICRWARLLWAAQSCCWPARSLLLLLRLQSACRGGADGVTVRPLADECGALGVMHMLHDSASRTMRSDAEAVNAALPFDTVAYEAELQLEAARPHSRQVQSISATPTSNKETSSE